MGYRFLRQKPVSNFIIDFYCFKLKLAIEIDGDSHDVKDEDDYRRDMNLRKIGIKTIRYQNDQIIYQLENVYYDLEQRIRDREKELAINPPPRQSSGHPLYKRGINRKGQKRVPERRECAAFVTPYIPAGDRELKLGRHKPGN